MRSYILTERGICFLRDGIVQWLSLDEFSQSDLVCHEAVSVLLGGVEFRTVSLLPAMDKIENIFPQGFIVRHERLKGGACLVMGVREEILNAAYNLFPRGVIKVCVPYGLAVRSLLLSHGLLLEEAVYLVVDHAGRQVFVTVIEGSSVIETRELVYCDDDRLIEEVRRSEKRCLEMASAGAALKIVSNYRPFLAAVNKQQPSRETHFIEEDLPVLGVMEKARFGIHFLSPSEDVARQRREQWRRMMTIYILALSVCFVAVVPAVILSGIAEKEAEKSNRLATRIKHQESVIRTRSVQTYQDRISSSQRIGLAESFRSLLDSIPSGWKIHRLAWRSRLDGCSTMEVLAITGPSGQFQGKGIFRKSEVSHTLIGGHSAVRLTYTSE